MAQFSRGLVLTALGMVLGVLALVTGALPPAVPIALLVLAALVGVAAEVMITMRPGLAASLERAQAGVSIRIGLREGLLAAYVAAWGMLDHGRLRLVVGGLALAWSLSVASHFLEREIRALRSGRVTWRNLEVAGASAIDVDAPTALRAIGVVTAVLDAAVVAGIVALTLGATPGALLAAVALSVLVRAGMAAASGARLVRVRGAASLSPAETADAVGAALAARGVEVVFYYSRPEAVGYIANVWMPVLHALPHRRFAVIAREQRNADRVETDTIPVVCVPTANDIERVIPPGVRLAMYPSNVATNNHLIRVPGIVDVFVGHGDSDKGGSATTLTRIYDEAWVSGPAARERYHVEQVGVRDDQIREIGRPQLAEITHTSSAAHDRGSEASGEVTVLYAPTREGFFASWQYSSILAQGRGIIETLLAQPGVRLLFKPHPGTGTDDPRFKAEVTRLEALVAAAGTPHEVVGPAEDLYAVFNRADVLVSDISSVITDFLASGKPYVVTDPSNGDVEEFRTQFPSSRGAWILAGDGRGVGEAVIDAVGADRYAAQRAETAAYLLGDTTSDPLSRFDAAIDDAVATVRVQPR